MRLFDRGVQARGNRQTEHATRVGGIDDAIVPEPGAGVIGVALPFVLLADRRLKAALVLFSAATPRASRLSRRTRASTLAACSPPITEIRAFGHIQRKRGE